MKYTYNVLKSKEQEIIELKGGDRHLKPYIQMIKL